MASRPPHLPPISRERCQITAAGKKKKRSDKIIPMAAMSPPLNHPGFEFFSVPIHPKCNQGINRKQKGIVSQHLANSPILQEGKEEEKQTERILAKQMSMRNKRKLLYKDHTTRLARHLYLQVVNPKEKAGSLKHPSGIAQDEI
ncbi:hypothetical protein CAPTEDRAFT_209788 [Capitella teleta]|uniref:Uncharacterized protein n=1 Tax=Capitella teleta TaxID=283909 RepID=R7T3Z9_CAPTE|nr:hypothetical protein CAPTEDRAFT_209788 [Capitella teleta]|eukprot:ELT87587.1 hypothetical protein CAPTEDRAFT_209788 [Capitella teleta]